MKKENNFMIEKQKTITQNQLSLAEKFELPRIDAATILADLSDAIELSEAQNSLEVLQLSVVNGDKAELAKMLTTHAALLDALFKRLLSDAAMCKSERLTVTVLELALKTAATASKTVLATNHLITASAPQVAIQING